MDNIKKEVLAAMLENPKVNAEILKEARKKEKKGFKKMSELLVTAVQVGSLGHLVSTITDPKVPRNKVTDAMLSIGYKMLIQEMYKIFKKPPFCAINYTDIQPELIIYKKEHRLTQLKLLAWKMIQIFKNNHGGYYGYYLRFRDVYRQVQKLSREIKQKDKKDG